MRRLAEPLGGGKGARKQRRPWDFSQSPMIRLPYCPCLSLRTSRNRRRRLRASGVAGTRPCSSIWGCGSQVCTCFPDTSGPSNESGGLGRSRRIVLSSSSATGCGARAGGNRWKATSCRQTDALVGDRPVDHGHAGERRHLHRNHEPGLCRRLALRSVLFRPAIAMVLIAAVAAPVFHRSGVYTAYEYLERRFDAKTRTLAGLVFLVQRGLGVGLALYAPAVVLSVILELPEWATIAATGVMVSAYTHDRRHQGGHVDRRPANDRHARRRGCRVFRGSGGTPRGCLSRQRIASGRRRGQAQCGGKLARLEQSLHALVGADRKAPFLRLPTSAPISPRFSGISRPSRSNIARKPAV